MDHIISFTLRLRSTFVRRTCYDTMFYFMLVRSFNIFFYKIISNSILLSVLIILGVKFTSYFYFYIFLSLLTFQRSSVYCYSELKEIVKFHNDSFQRRTVAVVWLSNTYWKKNGRHLVVIISAFFEKKKTQEPTSRCFGGSQR